MIYLATEALNRAQPILSEMGMPTSLLIYLWLFVTQIKTSCPLHLFNYSVIYHQQLHSDPSQIWRQKKSETSYMLPVFWLESTVLLHTRNTFVAEYEWWPTPKHPVSKFAWLKPIHKYKKDKSKFLSWSMRVQVLFCTPTKFNLMMCEIK